jgi:hypothetical protein
VTRGCSVVVQPPCIILLSAYLSSAVADDSRAVPAFELAILRAIFHLKGPKA